MLLYRLLATDMDGTLLNSRKMVDTPTVRSLQEAERNGTHIVICTGRAYSSAYFYGKALGLRPYILSGNGALAHDPDGNVLFQYPLEDDLARQVLDIVHRFRVPFEMFTPDAVVADVDPHRPTLWGTLGWDAVTHPAVLLFWLRHSYAYRIKRVPDASQYLTTRGPCLKFYCPEREPGTIDQALEALREANLPLEVSASGHDNFEVNAKGVDKGTGLARLAGLLGVDRSEVIAVGDNLNDLEMIRWAGLGVAVGNAAPVVKEAADHVTVSNDQDAVGAVLKEFVLSRP